MVSMLNILLSREKYFKEKVYCFVVYIWILWNMIDVVRLFLTHGSLNSEKIEINIFL